MILCFQRNKGPVWFLNNFLLFSTQYITTIRSSRAKFCGKTPVLEPLFSKVASLEASNFIKNRLQHRCFPVNITKFLRKCYLKNTTGCFCTLNSSRIWWHIINREIDDICLQYNTLCLYHVFFIFLSLSLAAVIKTR